MQYEDPEFNDALGNLTNISEFPEKPTIRLIPVLELVPVPTCGVSSDANSLADTEILSSSSSIDKCTQRYFMFPSSLEM